jgi:RecA-family ATPase
MLESQVDLAIFDPLVTLHSVSEIDSAKMDAVIRTFADIADETDAAIELAHHVRKPAAGSASDYDVHDIRGAAATIDAARAARVLNRMNDSEAEDFSMKGDPDRPSYFRVDRAKGNYSPARAATWHRFITVDLANGDSVGVVTHWGAPGQGARTPEREARERRVEETVLQLLDRFEKRDINVNLAGGPNHAPSLFAKEPEAKAEKMTKEEFKSAINRLLDTRRVRFEDTKNSRGGRSARRLVLWHGGMA